MTAPTGPSSLVTLSDVKDHLNLTDTSQDAELAGFISAATVFIENLTGPIIPRQYVGEVHSGGGPTIVLDNTPVMQVDLVTEYLGPVAYTLGQFTLGTDCGAYAYSLDDPQSGIIARRYTGGLAGRFFGGYRNVAVTYWAGRATVPGDIRMAVLQDIAGLFQPSQLGPASAMFPNAVGGGAGAAPNPIGLFPRVAAIMSAPSMRGPAIA